MRWLRVLFVLCALSQPPIGKLYPTLDAMKVILKVGLQWRSIDFRELTFASRVCGDCCLLDTDHRR